MGVKLVKIEDGLLEQGNFFEDSPFTDFIGEYQYSLSGGVFTLTEGYIERRFLYDEYVVVVEKENSTLGDDDGLYFYVRKGHERSGLIEKKENGLGNASSWKLIKHDGFVQGYDSTDGRNWRHRGGGEIPDTNVQGFQVEGDSTLSIKDYKVYKSPYVSVHGFEEGSIITIESGSGVIVSKAVSDEDHTAELFLDYPLDGVIKITTSTGVFVYETSLVHLKYGDVFSNTEYELELSYKGKVLDYNPTMLNRLSDIVVVKNKSQETYRDIHLRVVSLNTDTLQISLNNSNFSSGVIIPQIYANQSINLYIKIEKDRTQINYGTRQFALEID